MAGCHALCHHRHGQPKNNHFQGRAVFSPAVHGQCANIRADQNLPCSFCGMRWLPQQQATRKQSSTLSPARSGRAYIGAQNGKLRQSYFAMEAYPRHMKLPVAYRHGVIADVVHGFENGFAPGPKRHIAGRNRVPGIHKQTLRAEIACRMCRRISACVAVKWLWKSLVCSRVNTFQYTIRA